MSEGPEGRDSENNWVIPSAESLAVETVGSAQGGAEESTAAGSKPAPPPDGQETAQLPDVKPGTEPSEDPTAQEDPKKPDEVQGPPRETEGPRGSSTAGGDLEEVSCSSSDDDVEGLRKRVGRGAPPPISVGPTIREAVQQDADAGSSFNISTLVIAAIGLICISILVFSGGSFNSEDPTQAVMSRSVKGDDPQPPQVITDLQDWIRQHAEQFSGDPNSLQTMSQLLDKVAKENQEIRHMEAKLQVQREELEAILSINDGEKVTAAPQHPGLTEENIRLKEALLKEETAHLTAQEELQNLQEKMDVLQGSHVEKEALIVENTQLKVDLEAFRRQIEGFLSQKETLVAESQMLRQELDKQRLLVTSIRQDLENLVTKTSEGDDEKLLQERLSEMSSRLAMEAQRSETWEKTYVEHAERRKEQVGELRRDHSQKEWKKGDMYSKTSETSAGGESRKTRYRHGKRWTEDNPRESQHEEWRSKKHEHWKDKKHQHWEGENPDGRETWKNKAREHRRKDSAHHHHDSPERHHQGEAGDGFHPRKGQKEFTDRHKRQEDGKKGREHRHHDHNKFWKKLSDHQYRVPVGCSDLEDCARKDGMDLFNVELKPVQRVQFEEVLRNYLTKTQLSKHLPELMPLLDGFFTGPLFSHHKIRFKDFLDDVEDFLEDLARKETGNDDIVDDFERFVYTSFFGEAATKKRYIKQDKQQKPHKHNKPLGKLGKIHDKGINQSDDRHSLDNIPGIDHHVDCFDFKSMKKHKTHIKIRYKEESDHKHNPKSQNDENGCHSEKKCKYPHSKPSEEAGGHHHNGLRAHKQYQEYQGKHNYNPKNPGHQNTYKKQQSPKDGFGKDLGNYKHKKSDKYKEDVEHKHYSDKHEKDTNNKHYQSSQRHESHLDRSPDHKPPRDGDHRHRQPDHHGKDDRGKCRDHHRKHGEPEDRPRNYHQKYEQGKDRDYHKHGDDRDGDYHQKNNKAQSKHDRDGDYDNKYDKGHYKHQHDRDGEYHQKYNKDYHKHGYHKKDKDHHKHDRDGEYHHKHDRDGDNHQKYNKDHHKHDRDGEYHQKYDKDHHKHDRDGEHHHKKDKDHHKHDRDGEYHHKNDKDHHKHDRDGEYHHKNDKDHHKHDRDGEYHQKYDKDHHKHDRDGEHHHKKDKDHHKHDRDGEYHHKNDKDHHKHDRDGEYHHKNDKDHHKHDRDGEYHQKYDKDHHKHDRDGEHHHKHQHDGEYHHKKDQDHHKHGDDRDGDYQRYEDGKDEHTYYKPDEERR
ncbi:pre-B-cell leukemia transcription factor-interacting protein 1-like [Hyla sarda]|uniref:pre-B-cell leukemia transcription factor-interacting protein 1-like n=1 Tax=Hyla sarda TaxID=327740 RepID=UPI0024C2DD89|nr:pre-B-cell leukemia transcription factor-interacting protein 1-like [Hyla sarda]